ncbi:TIGR04540 family protein [Halobacillus sp. ACCC02827]|uniref:TIGR04540 family protein n=1 Tax=Halobacillus sp. ACCC02827 TaxID=3052090 RepID=UPI002570E3F5|nr:TIGR04540 family protein [Halobacillus sp. ACCC02827]WJE15758.1 TIGR04540 family protein [Halobacillus sp. ACCC02827]
MDWLGIKLFHRTQRDLASSINQVIDQYWNNDLEEAQMIDMVQNLYNNNESKFVKNGEYTSIINQQCGKRRLEVISKVLDLNRVK